ncbi:37S ribosomal protein, mitochondrial [Blyttiomyces sp. JEL0837]|nr:37S ribosomal protein, mitochondrial [Blyttiomyces sp. JEL0837]
MTLNASTTRSSTRYLQRALSTAAAGSAPAASKLPRAAAATNPTALTSLLKAFQENSNKPSSAANVAQQLSNLVPPPQPTLPLTISDFNDSTSVRASVTLKSLMAANLHLGHSVDAWNPRMLTYIYGQRGGIHIINLEHTLTMLRRTINITREVAMRGGNILFVGTKLSLHRITVEAANRGQAFFVTNWVPGTITNKERVLRRSVGYDPDMITQALLPPPSSKRGGGNMDMSKDSDDMDLANKTFTKQPYVHVPDLVIVLDMPNNVVAIREANQLNIPTIAICDTDCDPSIVQYPIPANDDSLRGVELIAGLLSMASLEGNKIARVAAAEGWGKK